MTLRTSHKRGFVLENILKFPLPSFYAQLAAHCSNFLLNCDKDSFHQLLLDVEPVSRVRTCTWHKVQVLDIKQISLMLVPAKNKAGEFLTFIAANTFCTKSEPVYIFSRVVYYRRIYDSLVRKFLCPPPAFQWKMIFITFSFNNFTHFTDSILLNAFFYSLLKYATK